MDYRLFYMRDGRVCDALELTFADDNTAIAFVRSMSNGQPKELWSLSRQVAVFEAKPPAADDGRIVLDFE